METKDIIILVLSGIIIVMLAIFIIIQLKSRSHISKADNVKIIDGVRYTKSSDSSSGNTITHKVGDFVLEQGVSYTVAKGGAIIPGKYTLLSCDERTEKFNIRIGNFVREYQHFGDVIFADGDVICAISHSVLLR